MAKKKETWIDNAWRPAIAWSYLVICIFDFFVAPIISAVFQSLMYPHQEYVAWKPNTLAEGGLYHMAMMAIVGVTAWTRAQEKMMRMGTPEDVAAGISFLASDDASFISGTSLLIDGGLMARVPF
jgi:hypothetical protein